MVGRTTRPRGIDWDAQPLGDVLDTVLSVRLGVTPQAVGYQRIKRHIPAATLIRVDWEGQPLGAAPDKEIAAYLGVCVRTVARQRRQRGIRRYAPRAAGADRKRCMDLQCRELFYRRRLADGHLERADKWAARKYCSRACSNRGRAR